MKTNWMVMMGAALLVGRVSAAEPAAADDLKTKASYGIGVDMARRLKAVDVDPEMVAKGLVDAYKGSALKYSDTELGQALNVFQQQITAKQKAKAESAKKDGEDFLAANAKKEGVKTTANLLQYKVLKEGTGPIPAATNVVSVHYRGTLVDGTEFDSSYKRNEPAQFPVNGVIAGWTEALQLMKTGSKWQLFIPSNLAYGEQGRPPTIPPNSALVFEVELLEIKN